MKRLILILCLLSCVLVGITTSCNQTPPAMRDYHGTHMVIRLLGERKTTPQEAKRIMALLDSYPDYQFFGELLAILNKHYARHRLPTYGLCGNCTKAEIRAYSKRVKKEQAEQFATLKAWIEKHGAKFDDPELDNTQIVFSIIITKEKAEQYGFTFSKMKDYLPGMMSKHLYSTTFKDDQFLIGMAELPRHLQWIMQKKLKNDSGQTVLMDQLATVKIKED